MKYSTAVVALAAGASAQSLSDIPSCALTCIDSARTKDTTCSVTDYACICDNIDALTTDATPCVLSACGADVAVNSVLPAVNTFCSEVSAGGGAATTTAAATTSTAEATTTSAAETTAETTAATTAASSSAAKTTSAAATSSYKATSAVASSSSHAGNATATSSPTTVVTAGAAAAATAGSIGMLLLGALAAL